MVPVLLLKQVQTRRQVGQNNYTFGVFWYLGKKAISVTGGFLSYIGNIINACFHIRKKFYLHWFIDVFFLQNQHLNLIFLNSFFFLGVGYGALIVSGIFCVYINIFLTWILYFLYKSMTPILPWSHCKNEWNTMLCHNSPADNESNIMLAYNTSAVNGSKYTSHVFPSNEVKMTASEEFWK